MANRKLEKDLFRSLFDPQDSPKRRRYIKKWIYGEVTPTKEDKAEIIELEPSLTIWQILHRVITGDD